MNNIKDDYPEVPKGLSLPYRPTSTPRPTTDHGMHVAQFSSQSEMMLDGSGAGPTQQQSSSSESQHMVMHTTNDPLNSPSAQAATTQNAKQTTHAQAHIDEGVESSAPRQQDGVEAAYIIEPLPAYLKTWSNRPTKPPASRLNVTLVNTEAPFIPSACPTKEMLDACRRRKLGS